MPLSGMPRVPGESRLMARGSGSPPDLLRGFCSWLFVTVDRGLYDTWHSKKQAPECSPMREEHRTDPEKSLQSPLRNAIIIYM